MHDATAVVNPAPIQAHNETEAKLREDAAARMLEQVDRYAAYGIDITVAAGALMAEARSWRAGAL